MKESKKMIDKDSIIKDSYLQLLLKEKLNIKNLKLFIVSVIAILLGILHLHAGMYGQPHFLIFRGVHVSLVTILAIILKPLDITFIKKYNYSRLLLDIIDNLMISIIVIVQIYILYDVQALSLRGGAITVMDAVMGTLYILIVLEATRRWIGPILVFLAIFFSAQNMISDKLFWIFRAPPTRYSVFIDQVFIRNEGIFGLPIQVITSFVVLFLIFAAILRRSGAGQFFIDIAFIFTGRQRGGPAKAAVYASSFLGMISGSSVANVVGTGSITIPLMKRVGYNPIFAGAVEAVASSGGQLMPPIMGATAFIIAQNLGIPYILLAFYAVIPAFLYYFSLFLVIDCEAIKKGLGALPEGSIPKLKPVLKKGAHLIFPIVALIYLLVVGYTPARASFMAIIVLVIVSFFREESRLSAVGLISAIEDGIIDLIPVSLACATAGMIIGGINVSGLGLKFTFVLSDWAGNNTLILLIVAAIVSIILGMGITTTAVYISVATLMAPVLVKVGINPIAAHMFVFYFGIISNITPPVAVAAYAASGISGANPTATAYAATKIGIAGFIIPFMIAYGPALVMQDTPIKILLTFITSCAGVYLMVVAVQGIFLGKIIRIGYRIVALCLAILMLIPTLITDLIGIIILLLIVIIPRLDVKKKKKGTDNSKTVMHHDE